MQTACHCIPGVVAGSSAQPDAIADKGSLCWGLAVMLAAAWTEACDLECEGQRCQGFQIYPMVQGPRTPLTGTDALLLEMVSLIFWSNQGNYSNAN